MPRDEIETVEVLYGTHKRADPALFGPLPGRRCGDVIAFESQAPPSFEPWPGRSRVERRYALLEVGVAFSVPCWSKVTQPDGSIVAIPAEQRDAWYVDLVTVERDAHRRYILRDLFVDVMIGDNRVPRMLDLDELADAYEAGWISAAQLTDGLRRWQQFLDRHLHASRFPADRLAGPSRPAADQPADPPLSGGPRSPWRAQGLEVHGRHHRVSRPRVERHGGRPSLAGRRRGLSSRRRSCRRRGQPDAGPRGRRQLDPEDRPVD